MCFRCEFCSKKVPAHQPMIKLIEETRVRTYPARERANRGRDEDGERAWIADPGGAGWEAVREVGVCQECSLFFGSKVPGSGVNGIVRGSSNGRIRGSEPRHAGPNPAPRAN